MSQMTISELWNAIQSGDLEIERSPLQEDPILRPLNLVEIANAISLPSNYVEHYQVGNYKELLRLLEDHDDMSLSLVLLKIICLLNMSKLNQSIGNKNALEYLRDHTIPQLRQVENQDKTGLLGERRMWLELFCYGRDLPDEFWSVSES
jgi:hypothetical protein